ncbi:Serine/threonine-protein kinase Nek2 [Savitreella phatthalungensis]
MKPDEYTVVAPIGKGSFGLVHKVQRRLDGAILCRKEILWARMSVREREQLAQELSILRGLQHPNIVQYITDVVDPHTKVVHIFMEYCGNGDLSDLIRDYRESGNPPRRVPESVVWQIFAQATAALHRCHTGTGSMTSADATTGDNVVLHRDIKPQNIFLDHNNRVKLGDFGLSKQLGSGSAGLAETYVGTPFYMSPELIMGRRYCSKSDIWALGCVIYEVAALTTPFYAANQEELNRKIRAGNVASLERYGYSAALNAAVRSCLVRDEASRPSAAGLLKLQEMQLARQVLDNADREAALLRREAEVVVREKQVEAAIQEKQEEFARREEALHRRELASTISSTAEALSRALDDARRQIDLLLRDKEALQGRLTALESTPRILAATSASNRPSLARAQTEDPLHLLPVPSTFASAATTTSSNDRPDSRHSLRSPHRRKSQIPMSRVRPSVDNAANTCHNAGTGTGIGLGPPKMLFGGVGKEGLENVRPHSATGFVDRQPEHGVGRLIERRSSLPRASPVRDLSMKTLTLESGRQTLEDSPLSPRKLAYPSPSRATARTLFGAKRVAPPAPLQASPTQPAFSRSNTLRLERERESTARQRRDVVIQTQPVHQRLSRTNSAASHLHDTNDHHDNDNDNHNDDDLPSPFIKRQYLLV